jgi:tetratricopeptide (TPR) repeat protein
MEELIKFFQSMKDQATANKLREWYAGGKIVIGAPDKGTAYYYGGKITIRDSELDAVFRSDGTLDFGQVANLSASLFHEFVHTGQGVIGWSQSEWYNWFAGGHHSENQAYFGTLGALANWMAQLSQDPALASTDCGQKGPAARRVTDVAAIWQNYNGDIENMSLEKREPIAKEYDDISGRISQAKAEIVRLMSSSSPGIGDTATAGDRQARIRALEADIRQWQERQKKLSEQLSDPWLDLGKQVWTTPDGKTLRREDVKQQVNELQQRMRAVIQECEAKAAPPKPPPPTPPSPQAATDYLNCLCRNCGGTMGGYYTKDAKSDCDGRCTCWGPLSGWCTPVPVAPQPCKDCYAIVYGVTNPTAEQVRTGTEAARNVNRAAMENTVRALLGEKKLDDALRVAENAVKFDPGMTSPMLGEVAAHAKKAGWDRVYQNDYKGAMDLLGKTLFFAPNDADAKQRYDAAQRADKVQWPQVQERAKEFYKLVDEKKVHSAFQKMHQIQDIFRDTAGGQGSVFWKKVMDDYNRLHNEANDYFGKAWTEWSRLFKEQEWEQAKSHIDAVFTREMFPAQVSNWEHARGTTAYMLGQRAEAMQYHANIKAAFETNRIGDYPTTVKELQNRAARFKDTDPRRREILDLAGRLEYRQQQIQAKNYALISFGSGDQAVAGQNYDRAAASYTEGLKAMKDKGLEGDPDYARYYAKFEDARRKGERIRALMPRVAAVAMDAKPLPRTTLQQAHDEAREVVGLQPWNSDAQIHLGRIQGKLKALDEADARRAAAQKLRAEGEQLQNQRRIPEAIAKYRESLRYVPDPALEQHIRTLEAALARPAQPPAQPPAPAPPQAAAGAAKVIFENGNIDGVQNAPTRPTTFSLSQPHLITKITNYHWNSGRGAALGTIALKDQGGETYGPWRASGRPGQGNVPNAYWDVAPNLTLPAGTYTVVDSDPTTWAQNSGSQGSGHTRIEGAPAGAAPSGAGGRAYTAQPIQPPAAPAGPLQAELVNNGRDNVHIFVDGADSAGPQNRLTPGQSRTIAVQPPSGGRVKFSFMRGGSWLGSCYWEASPDRIAVIRFTEDGDKPQPVCTTRLR